MTSRHASGSGRRGVASWIIVTVVAVVLVGGAALAYFLIVADGDDAQAACTSQVQLPVIAAPGATAAITAAAAAFDATAPVARSACVSTDVTTLPNAQAELALADGWQQAAGSPPAVWVPDSEQSLRALEADDSALTSGRDTTPIATSPVVIAVRDADAAGAAARPCPRGSTLSWRCPARARIEPPATPCNRCSPAREPLLTSPRSPRMPPNWPPSAPADPRCSRRPRSRHSPSS